MIGKHIKHYTIEKLLGKGGMGEVYKAVDTKLRRPVAIKILKPELTSDPNRRKRFLQEARAAAAVVHPSIAQVYEVDEVEGNTFIAMEFVEGETVSQLIVKRELDLIGSVEIALQVSEGLNSAHRNHIVHRDIKSDNIMVTRDGHAKLLDFGLAKLLDSQGEKSTADSTLDFNKTETMARTIAGTVMGTIAYMSPEQARGQEINQSSDVFSLGIVLYEMVTGELPFKGDSPLDTMHSIAFDEAKPVTVIRRNLPPNLHRIIARCLRKRPEDRFKDAGELAHELRILKQELDSGILRPLSPMDKIQDFLERAKSAVPTGTAGILAAVVILAVTAILIFTDISLASIFWIVVIALFIYRYVRNRKKRMLRNFVSKISSLSEVSAVSIKGDLVTIVVEKAQAKIYIRVNDLLNSLNSKLYLGRHVEVAIRDDMAPDEFQRMLREPGVYYIRDDVILEPHQSRTP